MSTPEERVQSLASRGLVSAAEQAALLDAMSGAGRGPSWRWLYDPFERFGGEPAALAGLVALGGAVALSRFRVRFDGWLDFHLVATTAPLSLSLAELLIGTVVPALAAWGLGRWMAREGRLVDALGVIGLARLPMVLLGPLVLGAHLVMASASGPARQLALGVMVSLAIVALGWQCTLLVNGLRNATGLQGQRLAVAVVALLVVGELLSSLLVALVARQL